MHKIALLIIETQNSELCLLFLRVLSHALNGIWSGPHLSLSYPDKNLFTPVKLNGFLHVYLLYMYLMLRLKRSSLYTIRENRSCQIVILLVISERCVGPVESFSGSGPYVAHFCQ
jgi:hypothetical protein